MSSVHIPVGPIELDGELVLPPSATGVVLFAHGSGSNRQHKTTAVVSRGDRPDLAGETALSQLTAPTLLIIGSEANWFEKHL